MAIVIRPVVMAIFNLVDGYRYLVSDLDNVRQQVIVSSCFGLHLHVGQY